MLQGSYQVGLPRNNLWFGPVEARMEILELCRDYLNARNSAGFEDFELVFHTNKCKQTYCCHIIPLNRYAHALHSRINTASMRNASDSHLGKLNRQIFCTPQIFPCAD